MCQLVADASGCVVLLMQLPHLMFSIIQEGGEDTINFTASSEEDFCLWTDGLNALMGSPVSWLLGFLILFRALILKCQYAMR